MDLDDLVELANTRAQNHRLNSQLRAVENRLSQTEGARIVADDLLPDAMIASLADEKLARRNVELDGKDLVDDVCAKRAAAELTRD